MRGQDLVIWWRWMREMRFSIEFSYTAVYADFTTCFSGRKEAVSGRFQGLQTAVEGAGVNPVDGRIYLAKVVCQFFRLFDAMRCERRICRNSGGCPSRSRVFACLRVYCEV